MKEELLKNPMEKAAKAFQEHRLISIKKINGQLLGPGYIMIMYGDVAFRMQVKKNNESYFIRPADIAEILFK